MKRLVLLCAALFAAATLNAACGKPAVNPPLLSFEIVNPGTPLADGGGILLDDGGVLLPDGGGTLQEDGGVILPDGGGTVQEDGGVILPDGGGTLEEDGGVILPDGGGVLLEDGGVLLPDGGGTLEEDGGVILADGGVLLEDGGVAGSGTDSGVVDAGEQPAYSSTKTAAAVPSVITPNTLVIQRQLTGSQPKCTTITLQNPPPIASSTNDGGLSLPAGWALQGVRVKNQICSGGGGSGTAGNSVNGVISFDAGTNNTFPTTLNVHADAFFTPGGGGFPPADIRFDADNVPVQ
ncbi:MAG: hypothetical protein ACJ790_19425 [Myxococcaceae bacterium]